MGFSAAGPFSVVTRTLTPAELLALSTTPVTLLPAKTGAVYIPYYVSFHKPAGVAYTAGNLVLETDGGVPYATLFGTGFLDQTAEKAQTHSIGGGKILTSGFGLQLRLLTAITTGDSALRVKLIYIEEYPGLAA